MNYGEPKRTGQQNRSLHLFCKQLSDALNLAGLEMKVVLKGDTQIWWTADAVKEYLWRAIQKAKYGKESTTDLARDEEITEIHKDLMRILGEKHGIEYIPFPSREEPTSYLGENQITVKDDE